MAWQFIVAAVVGYLLGSIPGGYLMGRLTRGIDVRQYGSGKTGATNALRTLSLWAVLLVLVIDIGKAAAAVSVARAISSDAWAQAIAGTTAVAGHVWPVYLRFRGGRGVSAAYGSMLAMNPLASLALLPVAAVIIGATRYMSLMSVSMAPIAAALFLALAAGGVLPYAYAAFAIVVAALIVVLHRDNVQRLLAGRERKIGQRERVSPKSGGAEG
ncbi:MAG: glycerol-3-phosphate 1-O-acyltransferase PlsY [Dehalococcoidia bacterium]|jgi:glycerol-3-phosphate acyltransferase PlsY